MKLIEVVWYAIWMVLFMAALTHFSWLLAIFCIGMIAFSIVGFAEADLVRPASGRGRARLRRLYYYLRAHFEID
jgi:hypothetical protein